MTSQSTSAIGAMSRHVPGPALVGMILVGSGTSSAHPYGAETTPYAPRLVEQTAAASTGRAYEHAGPAIGELRRLSGLNWEQLARLFGVSRRSLHFWASGKPMSPGNEEHLQRLVAVIRKIDRGSADANRSALLSASTDGTIPFDLLVAQEYAKVVALLGAGHAHRPRVRQLSDEAKAARAPRPPEELMGALQDRIHAASGRLLKASAVKVPRGK